MGAEQCPLLPLDRVAETAVAAGPVSAEVTRRLQIPVAEILRCFHQITGAAKTGPERVEPGGRTVHGSEDKSARARLAPPDLPGPCRDVGSGIGIGKERRIAAGVVIAEPFQLASTERTERVGALTHRQDMAPLQLFDTREVGPL